jgi:putative DNA primase/helicase
LQRAGLLARGIGFLARCLICRPQSTMGNRPYRPPEGMPNLAQYNAKILQLLQLPLVFDDSHVLMPTSIDFSPQAQALWIDYHDTLEHELRPDGDYFDVRDIAAKSAENVARLAALFHLLTVGRAGSVDEETMLQATVVGYWYLNETQGLLQDIALPADLLDAISLDAWLLTIGKEQNKSTFTRREIMHSGPRATRNQVALNAALSQLQRHTRVRLLSKGKTVTVEINPRLLERETPF